MVCKKLLTRVTCVALTGVVCLPVMAIDSCAMIPMIVKGVIIHETIKAADKLEKKHPAEAAVVEGALITGTFRAGGAVLAADPVTAPVMVNPVVQGVIGTTGALVAGANALRIQQKATNK